MPTARFQQPYFERRRHLIQARGAIGQRPYRQNNALCHQQNPFHKRCAQQVDARQKREQPDAQSGKAPSAQCGDALPPGSRVVGHFSRPFPEWDFIFIMIYLLFICSTFRFFARDARLSRFLFPLFVLY